MKLIKEMTDDVILRTSRPVFRSLSVSIKVKRYPRHLDTLKARCLVFLFKPVSSHKNWCDFVI